MRAISTCAHQVAKVYVIDNGSSVAIAPLLAGFENVECVILDENRGIATAINIGIKLARIAGYKYILFLDQDSVPPQDMVNQYQIVMKDFLEQGLPVAAVGPRYKNSLTGRLSNFVHFGWFWNSYESGTENSRVVPTNFLISSGSFYRTEIFDKVGLLDESLFIDHVDTEWCLRAASLGFQLFGVRDVVMEHSLGEGGVSLWLLRWRTQPMHKPFRLYYIARNSILLYQMKHVPAKWISGDVLRLVRLLLMYVIFSSQRVEAITYFFRGVRDGIQKVVGPAPNSP